MLKRIKNQTPTTVEGLKNLILELKAGRTMKALKTEDKKTYYKVQGLSSKLSAAKAKENNQFITKSDLTELKGLIIWTLNRRVNFKGYLNLKDAMTAMLARVETKSLVFVTRKSIKRMIVDLAVECGLDNVEFNLRESNGYSFNDTGYTHPLLSELDSHKTNVLMGN